MSEIYIIQRAKQRPSVEADLLAALESLLSVYVEAVQPTCPFGEAATAEQKARAAIAKAKGG